MKDRLLLNYHSFVGKTHFKLPAFFCPLIPSKQQFPEAMTCPCSWRPSREGHRGLLGPVLPTEEGSYVIPYVLIGSHPNEVESK
uniref:Spermatogenesis-associated protein 8 n=1 Tax=Callorhinus ursinus TaxID=34884 RepID=A0A3Q7QRD0_CALUR|nr:spermatogenesis-associated protein 8 [Callorhinus ursinus]